MLLLEYTKPLKQANSFCWSKKSKVLHSPHDLGFFHYNMYSLEYILEQMLLFKIYDTA